MNSFANQKNRSGLGHALIIAVALAATTTLAHAETVVRVSVKVVNDDNGRPQQGFYHTDGQIAEAFEQANTALRNNGAGWRLQLQEISDIHAPDFFYMGCGDLPALEQTATANPAAFKWRGDAINMFVVTVNEECGGACSFSNGITGSEEAIIINNYGISADGVGWLHEIGHYFGLWHTFQCMDNGQPCDHHDVDTCTGAGGLDRRCPDACPDGTNVMSYHPGIHEHNATLSTCQLDVVRNQMATTRGHVIQQDGAPVQPQDDPNPVDPGPVDPGPVGRDDNMEENDTAEQAAEISAGTYELVGADEDWFMARVEGSGTLAVQIRCNTGDLDLILFDAQSGEVLVSSEEYGSNEIVQAEVGPGNYAVLVYPYDGEAAAYTMSVTAPAGRQPSEPEAADDRFEDNDTPQTVAAIEAGTLQLMCADQDWFGIPVEAAGMLSVTVDGAQGDLDLILFDAQSGDAIATSEQQGSHESVSAQVEPGMYVMLIYPYDGVASPYTLTVDAPQGGLIAEPVDPVEPKVDVEPTTPTDVQPTVPFDIDVNVEIPEVVVPINACGAGAPPALALGLMGMLCVGAGTTRRVRRDSSNA
jgi:hypothetical protein